MKKTIENYVFPVCCGTKDGESDGCGVLVGDLFITAGHVIEHSMVAHVYIDHKDYELNKEDALYYSFDDKDSLDTNASDVAVFKLEGVTPSPLALDENSPSNDDVLTSVSYLHYGKKNLMQLQHLTQPMRFMKSSCAMPKLPNFITTSLFVIWRLS